MATGTFTNNSKRTKPLKTLIKTQRKVLKTSNIRNVARTKTNLFKNMAFYVPIGCVRFARYCGKIYSCHMFSDGGFYLKLETKAF